MMSWSIAVAPHWGRTRASRSRLALSPDALSAAHGHHDLQPVAVRQAFVRVRAARHDLAVALERDTFTGELQAVDQLGRGQRSVEVAALAVDGESDHETNLTMGPAARPPPGSSKPHLAVSERD